MNATPLEVIRFVIATGALMYVARGAWQMWADYTLLSRTEDPIARTNAINGVIRVVGIFGMWSVALLSCLFDSFSSAWATYAQVTYTVVIVCLGLIGRNIRRAQHS